MIKPILLSLLAALGVGTPRREPPRLAVAPLVVAAPCKFAGPDKVQTAEILEQTVRSFLAKACDASDTVLIDPVFAEPALERAEIDFSKTGHRKKARLQEFGKAVNADFVAVVVLDWSEQKNADLRSIASNPNAGGSTSRVRIRLWLQNVREDALAADGEKKTFEGEAKGPYFGTVDPREISGDPVSKGLVIQSEYKKRARWLGQAVVAALRGSLLPLAGLREPESRARRRR